MIDTTKAIPHAINLEGFFAEVDERQGVMADLIESAATEAFFRGIALGVGSTVVTIICLYAIWRYLHALTF